MKIKNKIFQILKKNISIFLNKSPQGMWNDMTWIKLDWNNLAKNFDEFE